MAIIYVLIALTSGSTVSTTATFTAGSITQSTSSLAANPNSATANNIATIPLIFTGRDAYNNTTPGVNVTLSASGSNNNFGASTGTTDANGNFSTTLKSSVAQTKTVIASFGLNSNVRTNATLVAGPASAGSSSLVVNPNSAIADNSNTLTAILTLLDAQGNPISGATPSFSASGTSTTVNPGGNTSASGQASATYRTSLAQSENAVVAVGGVSLSAPILFLAGPPATATSTLSANPNIAPGNAIANISLVVTARDAQGNNASGASVSLSASGSNNTFAAANGTTLSNGTYTTTLKSSQMQTQSVTALIGSSANETVSVTFTGSPNAATSSLTVSPNTTIVGPNNSITATLTLKDAAANPLAGVVPNWSSSGGNNTIASSGATSSLGIGTATYSTTLAQSENIIVAVGGLNLSQPVSFTAASPNAVMSYVFAIPARQAANNSNTIAVTAMLIDSYNNPVAGQPASFAVSDPNTIYSAPTNADSTGMIQGLYKTAAIQNANATISAGGLALATPLIFTDTPSQCIMTLNPNTAAADGNSKISITVTVSNSNNTPINNARVVFSTSGSANFFSPQTAITTGAGQATSLLTSPYAGINTISVHAETIQCSVQAQFTPTTPYCSSNPNYLLTSLAVSDSPRGIAVADFNKDGKLDIAAVGSNPYLSVVFGNNNATFQPQVNYALSGLAEGICTNDFNGDGYPDLATASSSTNIVNVFVNDGTGGFPTRLNILTASGAVGIMSADFNADGIQDLAVSNTGSGVLSIVLGGGNNIFAQATTYASGTNAYFGTSADFNGDGFADVILAHSGDNTIGVFLGVGDGTMRSAVTYPAGNSPIGITSGDFNGDGILDIAVTAAADSSVNSMLGNGDGTFQAMMQHAVGSSPHSVYAGDFNGDGVQDLAVSNSGQTNISILLGSGTGSFQTQVLHPTAGAGQRIGVGDFNNDNHPDLVIGANATSSISLLLYNSCN